MRKLRSALCALCLLLLIPLALRAWRVLPLDRQPLIAEKYAGWSGVLRLWIFEGWQPGAGSLSGWLNGCIAGFEKSHPGLYVQPEYVSAEALSDFLDSGILPPDMLLFPPGLLDTPEGLAQLKLPQSIRPAFSDVGAWDIGIFAAPVAAGGYLIARNASLLDALPQSWRDGDAVLAVPFPEDWRHWDLALMALCSEPKPSAAEATAEPALPGLDLGLLPEITPAPSASPPPAPGELPSCRLPEDFDYDEGAWHSFINGQAAALAVTQREVRRLQSLADQGRGPDWALSGNCPYTDQVLCLAVLDRPDGDPRPDLCREFLEHLLDPACQGALRKAGAFSVTDAPSGYGQGDPLLQMEQALRSETLCVPCCFDGDRFDGAEKIVRKFIENDANAARLWRDAREILTETPND
ncbi:MAG: hypothetical protein Q4C10_06950 [Clostridia bacterium]|nr:hypothetical protein [Clostridia bacterium]